MKTKKPRLNIPEKRVIQFVDHLKDSGEIRFKKEFYDKTGITRQYFRNVTVGKNRFTTNHIQSICRQYNVNANWIFGVQANMYRRTIKSGALIKDIEPLKKSK